MKRFTITLILIFLLALVALPLLAQEDEATQEAPAVICPSGIPVNCVEAPAPVVIGDLVVDTGVYDQLHTVGINLFKLLWAAAYLPFTVPMVTVLVALSKRILTGVSGSTLQFSWTVALWLAFLAATQLGFGDQFKTSIGSLATLGSTFLGITLTPVGAGAFYNYANNNNVAIIGYKRPVSTRVYSSDSPQGEKVMLAELEHARD